MKIAADKKGRTFRISTAAAAAAAALLGVLGSTPAATEPVNLLSNGSFEGSLSGWRGNYATLSLTSGGVVGASAARVSLSGSARGFSIYPSPRPVSATQAGAVYRAGGWERALVATRNLCLRIREWSPSGSIVGSAETCRKSTTGWAGFAPLTYTARETGNELDVYVYQWRVVAGDRFDVDGLWLTADSVSTPDLPGGTDTTTTPDTTTTTPETTTTTPGTTTTTPDTTTTTPTQPPLGVTWSNGFGTWGGTAIPDASWRPFADTSPFNRRVPANPPLLANSPEIMTRIWAMDGDADRAPQNLDFDPSTTRNEPNGSDWSHPIYWSKPTDPKLRIHCVKYGCPDLEGKLLPVPAAARAADGGDGHFGLVLRDPTQPYDRFVVDLYEAYNKPTADGATWNVGSGGISRIDGDGTNVDIDSAWNVVGQTGPSEATAARFSVLAGMMRPPHIAAGRIPHALFLVVNCDSGQAVYPAERPGRACSAIGQSNTNAPPMGARLWLDMSEAEVEALNVKRTLKTILHAFREYGAIAGDTGGGGYGLMFESPETYHSFGLQSPLLQIAQREGWALYNGQYILRPTEVPDSVWSRMKVLDPCVSRGIC